MASLCKSQQCSIERRGFRQELDSWRHKLIHCVGFETILEGLFGPALLDDLSLFKDCEPTGVCDWSFDENCLFCCLRREKVKEHLAGFHKPINETGQENFLKQEQAKIIRLERQAEEFINAVFYKKDSPRISDPNIPLVAREIMQRMIRQFAAEYTSKNSSTQDSSPPNSTKNQSLQKSPSGQSSPPPATTQNPVLSKLLMADQDSPLDLTVKKPHLEEPCEQADGVLDLSTKKSPCSGSPNSSISPSTSNNIGNGSRDTEKKAIDPNNSSLSLEMFMAKLCSHHQKQFILVLNNLCTEESIMKSKSRSASVSKIESHDNIDGYDHSCSDRKADLSLFSINKSYSESCLNCQVSINTPTNPHEDRYHSGKSHCSGYLSKVPISSDYKEDHVNISHATDQTITYNPLDIPTTEEKRGAAFAKISDASQTVFLEHCVLSNSNSSLNMLYDSSGSELSSKNPEIANKENTQSISPKQMHIDCTDCKLKHENSPTTGTAKKLENHYESPFQDLADHSASSFQKLKLHENKRIKNVNCKNTRVLTTNDCDTQCDVVYISEPVTTECHFENHKSVVCRRNTARKSTRGYLFSGNCCELSTVRTLVRSSKVEDQGNAALHTSEALIFPNGLIQTLPSTDILSLMHVEEKSAEMDTFDYVPQNDEMPATTPGSSRNSETENCEQSLKMAEEPVEHNSDSLIPVFSLEQNDSEKTHVLNNHVEMALDEHDIPKMELNSVVSTDANSPSVNDLAKSVANLAADSVFEVSHSNNSCNQDDSSGTPSLDMEVIVSLKNNHVLSQSTPERSPHDTLMEDASATLQYSQASLSMTYSSSFLSRAADNNLSFVGSSSVNDAKILPDNSSDGVITDPVFSSDQHLIEMSSDYGPKENFESHISKTLQDDLSSSDIMIKFNDTTQGVAKENVDLIHVKTEKVKDGQSVDLNDSVKMTEIVVPENIGIVQPILDVLHCPTPDALRPSEHFHSPLNKCAKIVGNITVKLEANGSNEDLNYCGTVSSSECNKNYTLKKPLKIEVVNGESKLDDSLDEIDNSLVCNKKTNMRITPIKRHKKAPAPTDRCLRSHDSPGDPPFHKISSIQVLISGAKGTNSAQRSVELRAEDAPHATVIHSFVDETINAENYFAMSINGHCQEGKPLLWKKMLENCSSPFKMSKSLKVCFETDSDKRMVSFGSENNHNCQNMVKTEYEGIASSLRNTSQLHPKAKKESLENSTSISQTKSSNKQVTVKDKLNYCKSGKLKNLSVENKQINDCNNQISKPKFLDWCSEEENHERISSFNDKYSTIHKNWIPVERDVANVIKSKNKSDKLKEIWKTKKRVRRPKSVQDAPKCSPMQMLFMNTFKLSDICRWFMETTETKSLVIVKKLNTRLPEEHQLPMIQSPKYSSESLYPHTLQAQRLKKHLKKFASICPALNDLKTQNSLNTLIEDSSVPLDQVSKDTVKGPNDCQKQEPHDQAKKTAPVHLLKKDNRLRENFKFKSCTANKSNLCMVTNTKKVGNAENIKEISTSESSLQKVPNFRKMKNEKSRKRSKNDSPLESVPQLTKKKKIEAKQGLLINSLHVNKNVSPKTKVSKLSKTDMASKSQDPKKQVAKAGVFKTRLRKGKAKTPMQKQSLKSQLVQTRMTRSAKQRPISTNISDSTKITSFSSSHRKKELRKLCTVSGKSKINVTAQVRQRKERSQQEPSTRKRRSLEFK